MLYPVELRALIYKARQTSFRLHLIGSANQVVRIIRIKLKSVNRFLGFFYKKQAVPVFQLHLEPSLDNA
jgi:hypothetical protein